MPNIFWSMKLTNIFPCLLPFKSQLRIVTSEGFGTVFCILEVPSVNQHYCHILVVTFSMQHEMKCVIKVYRYSNFCEVLNVSSESILMQPCLLKDGSLRRETLPVILSDKCKTHSRDSQLDSYNAWSPLCLCRRESQSTCVLQAENMQCCFIQMLQNMICVRFAVTTDIYFTHKFKTTSRYSSSTVGRVIYSTQIW